MSIDYNDMCLSFVLLMVELCRSYAAVDWCIVMICHNMLHFLPVDDSGVRPGLSCCGQ